MLISQDLQSSILEAIKTNLPPTASLVDALADCLSISRDSAYRRIRSDTLFGIGEIEKLAKRYNLSLDSFFGLQKSSVSFSVRSINLSDFTFKDYLESIENNLTIIKQLESKHLYYSARDIPIFHYFQLPGLSSFKSYFWLRYYLNHPALQTVDFTFDQQPELLTELSATTRRIWQLYLKIPSTEIWTYETANITLRQIEFAYHAGIITRDVCEELCDTFKRLLAHIKLQAREGNKFTIGSQATLEGAEFNLYFNEVAIGDNSILFKMNDKKMAFNTYGNLNYMHTTDQAYTDYIETHFQSTMKNSTLISTTSQKIRSEFFNSLSHKIDQVTSKIQSYSQLY